MLNPAIKIISLDKNAYQEYARHFMLNEIGVSGQKRLKKSKILCVGAGGLACPCILYLLRSGIGCLGIIDNDTVSYSNLNRQILYEKLNINLSKVACLMNSKIIHDYRHQIITYEQKLDNTNAINIIKNYDMVIDACDNFKTRYIIEQTCNILHKVHIYGAINELEGQISVFNYQDGPKYSDLYPKEFSFDNNQCNNTGVLGVVTGLIGIMQACETLKVILGIKNILSGKILLYNFLESSFKTIRLYNQQINRKHRKNKIYLINKNAKILENLDKIEFNTNELLIDTRQTIEFDKQHLQKAINIPVNKLNNQNTEYFLKKYCNDQTLITYCSENSRSIKSSQIFTKYGINHFRLKNGLNNSHIKKSKIKNI